MSTRPHCNHKKNKTRTQIRELNDSLRKTLNGGHIHFTSGVLTLGSDAIEAALDQVRRFANFDRANDPYSEHDFGVVEAGDQRVFWKIDYYDRRLEMGSPDPADPLVTTRVLTIMLASEY